MSLDIRTRKDDNGRDDPGATGVPGVTMDVEGEMPEDKRCCCGWVRVDIEGLVFFIEEREGGGGRLWRVRYWEEEVEVSWRLSDIARGGEMGVVRLRRGGGEGRGCRWRGFATGLRWGVRETWRPIAICSMVGRVSG